MTNSDQNQAEISRLLAETSRLNSDRAYIDKKIKWYEYVLIGSFAIGLLAAGKYLL